MEQKKYTLAEAARILGETFINMANSLEVNKETCSPECEKRCLGECDSGDKCKKYHNDYLDAMTYAMKAFDNENKENLRKYYEQQKENFCKKVSDDPDKAAKDAFTKYCEQQKEEFEKKISNGNNKAVEEAFRKDCEQQKENFCKKVSTYPNPDEAIKENIRKYCEGSFTRFIFPTRFIFDTSSLDEVAKSLLETTEETKEFIQMVNDIKINFIKKLSKETGYGLINCKKALIECDYDYDKAKQYLMEDKLGTASILT